MKKHRPLIGVVIKDADHDFWGRSLKRLQKEFFAADMDVAIFSAFQSKAEEETAANERAIFQLVHYDKLDGLVVYLDRFQREEERNRISETVLKDFKKPVIYIRDGLRADDTVVFDNDEGTRALICHLARKHQVKTAAYVSGPKDSNFHRAIYESFAAAMEKYNVSLQGEIWHTNDWVDDYTSIAEKMIQQGLPDAVVCCSEMTAASMIRELTHQGVQIPEDVIVTGYRFNEPHATNHFNITSVLRLPEMMAVNAARKLISRVRGVEMEQVSMPTCEFKPGLTCGCRGVDLEALSQSAFDELLLYRSNGFNSRYNYMQEDLVSSRSIEDYFWKLDHYCQFLGDAQGIWVCLNQDVLHTEKSSTAYTEEMQLCYSRKNGVSSVDFQRYFPLSEMLPELYAERDLPAAFLFNAFHFADVNFGYVVLSYGDSSEIYDENYGRWLRYAASGLENKRQQLVYQDAVENMRTRDGVTGLLNMRGYQTHMQRLWTHHQAQGHLLRVIALSIENLAGIRDAYGYQTVDMLLQKFANMLNNSIGSGDICARLSNEAFLIAGLMKADSPVDDVPMRLQRNLDQFNDRDGAGFGISVSSATQTAPFDTPDVIDALPAEADFQRKLNRENSRIIYAQQDKPGEARVDKEEQEYVAHMLDENLLSYHFQPIVNARDGSVVAFEALMRSATGRQVTPLAVLQHAKALGRLKDVERLTITNLLAYLSTHATYFHHHKLFINSIPSCILSEEEFAALKKQYGDLLEKIAIEFTEQSEASDEQLNTLLKLRKEMGFSLAVDDYGTGYSNINSLLTLMPNYVKIDRSLISNIHEDRRKKYFVENIIEYAHNNDFLVLAEGVEQIEELRTVIRMGIDLIQGYYTGRPAPKPESVIGDEIVTEICEAYRSSQTKQVSKVYYTGSEKEILLHTLDFNDYTELFITNSEYTIHGRENFSSSVMLRIKDGLTCRLTLDGVNLKNNFTPVCIELGENSKVELNIVDQVAITGAIRVPATADITLCGDGYLSIFSCTGQTFGIGNDLDQSYGNITMRMDKRVHFQLDTIHCVAIGGGRNDNQSRISIEDGQVDVNLAGRQVVGVGSMDGEGIISINNCGLSVLHNCRRCIALGGGGGYQLTLESARLKIECHGDEISGIFSKGTEGTRLRANNSSVDVLMRGKKVHCIGTEEAFMNLNMVQCGLEVDCNGVECYVFGNAEKNGIMNLRKCRGTITVETHTGKTMSLEDDRVILDSCQLTMR